MPARYAPKSAARFPVCRSLIPIHARGQFRQDRRVVAGSNPAFLGALGFSSPAARKYRLPSHQDGFRIKKNCSACTTEKGCELRCFLLAVFVFFTSSAIAQMRQQALCAHLVKGDIEATKQEAPQIYQTLAKYFFEWSPRYHACVVIIQYRVYEKGKSPQIQIVATNAVTMQPMEGYKNIFLEPADEEKEIEDATNFLFERYSH